MSYHHLLLQGLGPVWQSRVDYDSMMPPYLTTYLTNDNGHHTISSIVSHKNISPQLSHSYPGSDCRRDLNKRIMTRKYCLKPYFLTNPSCWRWESFICSEVCDIVTDEQKPSADTIFIVPSSCLLWRQWRVVTNITLTRPIYYLLQQEVNSLQHRAEQWHGEVLRSWWKVMLLSWYWWRPLCDTDHARDTLSPLNTSQLCRQQKIFDQDHNMVVMKNLIEECLIRLDDEVGLTINLGAECWSVGTKSDIKYLTHCCVTLII